ncbi:MAG TPA: protein translocase subunit SecD [Gaiellaceae bacterium]|nr:protein translocase subunit SecD [Gaiellaceae bacterium]
MRRYFLILLALFGAIAGVVALGAFREPTLGLDLQGGLEVVLEARPEAGQELTEADLDRSVEIIRNRVDKIGVSEPEIRKQGSNQIVVDLAGVFDQGRAADIIGQTAQLEFYDLAGDVDPLSQDQNGQPLASATLLPLLSPEDEVSEGAQPREWYLYSESKSRLAGPAATKEELLQQVEGGEAPEGAEFYVVPSNKTVLTCGPPALGCPGGVNPAETWYYLYRYQPNDQEEPIPALTGEDLNADGTRQDFGTNGEPIVLLDFTDRGGDKFHDITRELSQRGATLAAQNGVTGRGEEARAFAQSFAIVLDSEIRSFPIIDFTDPQLADGIAGGSAQITGLDSLEEAEDLALVLQTGALPVEFVQVDRTTISATLGEDSLREALIAGIGGLIAVALFLLVVYRFLGVVAIVGLAVYGVFLYGAILLFNVTMTLPGIAGIILTIGVAADANIVIFERIKEEVRAGKSVRAAIATGYRKGFATIVDANVVTMITAFVLFAAATGGVRGFALMLLIGTLISMITAVLATRALLGVLAAFRWFDNPAFMGASAQKIPDWQKIDIVGKRRIWFSIATAALVISVAAIAIKGLNLGIDFRGGSQVSFETPRPVTVDRVREEAAAVGLADAVIQGRGDETNGGYEQFQIKTETLSEGEQAELTAALRNDLDAEAIGVRSVSGSFSEQILRGAILAIVVSLLLIVIYVTIRFEFVFALPIFRALFYDVTVAMGVYALVGWEVTAATVAAILTILGYSMYDTIIIFDRVRENIPLMRKSSFAAIANQSLWETVRRSLATSFITLLPITALILFGGDTLKEFAFALLIGIGSGAFSTVFIATPFLAVLKEREPEYQRRKDAGLQEKLDTVGDKTEGRPVAEEVEEPAPAPEAPEAPAAPEPAAVDGGAAAAAARREARRKRRRARPHGRAR